MSRSKRARTSGAQFIVRPLFAALVASGLAAPVGVHAANVVVSTGGDAGTGSTCTLRQAVDSLNLAADQGGCTHSGSFGTNDVVDLSGMAGTITLVGSQLTATVNMGFQGPGTGSLAISGAGSNRILYSNAAPFIDLTIDGVTLLNGKSAGPGGCIFSNGRVNLFNSIVTGCTALHSKSFPSYPASSLNGFGGGVYGYDVRMYYSTVSGNTAQTGGGGIFGNYVFSYRSQVVGNTVLGHSCNDPNNSKYCITAAFGGGGILGGSVLLETSNVSGNTVHATSMVKYTTAPATQTIRLGMGGGVTEIGKYASGAVLTSASTKTLSMPLFVPRTAETRAQHRAMAKSDVHGKTVRKAFGGPRSKTTGTDPYILGLWSSTISGNTVTGPGIGGTGQSKYVGAGAAAFAKYNAEVANSTISNNRFAGNPTYGLGSGLITNAAHLTSSTITGNNGIVAVLFKYNLPIGGLLPPSAKSKGKSGETLKLWSRKLADFKAQHPTAKVARNKDLSPPQFDSTIIASNPVKYYDFVCSSSCTISGANNLIPRTGGPTTLPPDTLTSNPNLAPLANNGGWVAGAPGASGFLPTHMLYLGSPAIDKGSNIEGFQYDQRGPGFPRVLGAAPEIGATEGAIPPPSAVPAIGPWMLGMLSALLGALGLFTRRRRRA